MSDHAAHPEDLTRHADALRRIALAVVRDEAAADDVLQSAYVTALERPGTQGGFAWMASVVHRRAIDFCRRVRARSRVRARASGAASVETPRAGPRCSGSRPAP